MRPHRARLPGQIRRVGALSNLDKRRTILENIRRQAREQGEAKLGRIKKEDLRFKSWEEEIKYESNAVVLALMDTSGSMGEFKKYIARSFYFWMVRFLRTNYDNVKIVFISHHTEAKEVTEEQFFTQGESGGTVVSSAYKLALEIIAERFPPRRLKRVTTARARQNRECHGHAKHPPSCRRPVSTAARSFLGHSR